MFHVRASMIIVMAKKYSTPPTPDELIEVFGRLLRVEQNQLIALSDLEKRTLNMTMVLSACRDGITVSKFLDCDPFRSVPLRLITTFLGNEMAVIQ